MPITITLPEPDQRVGPGLQVHVASDFVGPLPSGSFWQATVSEDDDALNILWLQTVTGAPAFDRWQWLTNAEIQIPFPSWMLAAGATVFVTVQLINALTLSAEDTGQVAGIYEPSAGLGLQAAQQSIPAGIGMTDEDRVVAAATLAATRVSLPALGAVGGLVVKTLGELAQGFPPQFVNRHDSVLITGQGSIARLTEPYRFDCLGLEWHWHTIPAGFGSVLGSVAEYYNRVVQFRLIDMDSAGQLFQSRVLDSNTDGERFMWGGAQPVTVEYFVAPGCVVELSFLVLIAG